MRMMLYFFHYCELFGIAHEQIHIFVSFVAYVKIKMLGERRKKGHSMTVWLVLRWKSTNVNKNNDSQKIVTKLKKKKNRNETRGEKISRTDYDLENNKIRGKFSTSGSVRWQTRDSAYNKQYFSCMAEEMKNVHVRLIWWTKPMRSKYLFSLSCYFILYDQWKHEAKTQTNMTIENINCELDSKH